MAERTNIIVIMSDDQGPWAMGCAGTPEIRTPNLDALAATGTRFTRFFCASPVCSPARASVLTGQIPSQHGVHDWIERGSVASEGREPIRYLEGKPCYTDVLAEAGYTCGLSGKWHLGDSLTPQHGFTHWYTHQRGGGPYYGAPMIRNGELVDEPGYLTDAITDDALAFIDREANADQPFYLSVHYTAPHSPWIDAHPEDVVARYADCDFASIPRDPIHPWALPGWAPEPDSALWRAQLTGYFAAVTAMDANIGRILNRLDELDIARNTLVVFLSDNGFNCGHHGLWGKGNASFPLNMYDESVMVPCIMRWPGHVPAGIACDALTSALDIAPTLLDLVGLAMPNADVLPGSSFRHLLADDTSPHRQHVVIHDEYGPVRMIRSETWKYVHRTPYGPHELYNLVTDPGERMNLVDDPDAATTLTELRGQLDAWFVRYADPAVDGRHEAVTGSGQWALAGPANGGEQAFNQSQRLDKEAEIAERRG